MDRLVSNATPLIYLAKAHRLDLLQSVVKQTLIPEAVYREVVVAGKLLGETDVVLIEEAIKARWIVVRPVKRSFPVNISLHPGEVEVISLAKEAGIRTVLMDDAKARLVSEVAGLTPRGTLWLLLEAVRTNILDFDQFLRALEDIMNSGFYLKEDLYLRAIKEARQISSA
jgi:predicted nucleic acid-binding protein